MENVVVCGINHKTSPIEERERFSFSEGAGTGDALRALVSAPSMSECVIVSTCNRVEIYAACEDGDRCFDTISGFLCDMDGRAGNEFIEKKFYFLEGADAVSHLYRVAAGLDSMVVGEPQILGQLKRSYETALENGAAGPVLNKLFQSAFSSTKKIKNETGFGSHTVSVSSVAVKLAKNIFGDIEKCRVMVVGTGEAAAEAATELAKRGAGEIRIAGRDKKEAAKLASSVGGKTIGIGEIGLWMRQTDIVITATGSANYILKTGDLSDAMKLRKNRPVSLIDIAFPRDVDPKARNIEGVFLYDMDDLQNIVDKNLDSLRKSVDMAEEMIRALSERFISWRDGLKAFPLIVELRKKTGRAAEEEIIKAISRMDALEKTGDLGKEERDGIVRSLADRLAGKFLHTPVTKLKREAALSPEAKLYADTVKKLFDLHETAGSSENEDKDRKQG